MCYRSILEKEMDTVQIQLSQNLRQFKKNQASNYLSGSQTEDKVDYGA